MNNNRPIVALLALLSLALGACSTSAWESAYVGSRPERAQSADRAAASRVSVRNVPWERIEATRRELEGQIAASDTHPDEWPAEKRAAAKAALLRGLQVSENPDSVDILGRSEFSSTSAVRPDDGELAAFAAKIGATRVVWSSRYLGKADKIVSEPVWTWTSGSEWSRRSRSGPRRSDSFSYSQNSTTWVPVVVQADETAWVAYFLRDE